MIASERSQNIIVVAVIITAIVSSGFLVSNAQYYGGSYSLAGRMTVTLTDIQVRYIDHENATVEPQIRLYFQMNTSSEYEGSVRITFVGATVILNDDLLSYTSFAFTPPDSRQVVTPDYNETFTMANVCPEDSTDRATVLDADTTDIWNWDIEFRYSFIVFDERGTITWRRVYFETSMVTII